MADVWQRVFDLLLAHHGPQRWWPAQDAEEVAIGAVLTQNTSWNNASAAVTALRESACLSAEAIAGASEPRLAGLIRSAGTYRVKARRLRALCAWIVRSGGLAGLADLPTPTLRTALLAVHGIGPETADAILLYALQRPVFVIDAYTLRLFRRIGLLDVSANYDGAQAAFMANLPASTPLFNEYHALIVAHGKSVCRKRPRCGACVLAPLCATGRSATGR